jgi:deoxyribonuclease V
MDPERVKSLRWPEDKDRLRDIQEEIKKEIRIIPLPRAPELVAGIDASFTDDRIVCAACLFSFPRLELIEESVAVRKLSFPYITGYLSFREGPAVLDALAGLSRRPGLLIFDGQGIAHPRGAGLAAFMGVLVGLPSIGCAKTKLVGEYSEPGEKRGDHTALVYKGASVGAVLRTQDRVKPVFVSPGNMIDIEGSVRIVLGCAPRYRLTEPVRAADKLSRKIKKELMAE